MKPTIVGPLLREAMIKFGIELAKGNPDALRRWYESGAESQIKWGEKGDLTACHDIAMKYMTSEEAWGFCERRAEAVYGESNRSHDAKAGQLGLLEFTNDCHNPEGSPEGGRFCKATGQRLATAVPSGPQQKKQNFRSELGPRMSLDLISDVSAVVERQATVPGFEDVLEGRTPEQALGEIVKRQTENIFDYADTVVGANKAVSDATADWYPFSNVWVRDLAAANGHAEEAGLGAVAVLSSGAPWESNVAWGKFLMEELATNKGPDKGINQKVDAKWVMGRHAAEVAKWATDKKEFENSDRDFTRPKPDPGKLAGLIGKPLSELSDREIAEALRGKHESGATGNPKRPAEGKLVTELGEEIHAGFGTKGKGTIPQSTPNIAKAVSVIRNPSPENIDDQIGDQNKVRSFYQNLRDPKDTEFSDVTVDTHHFGVANGIPWTMGSRYIGGGKEQSRDIANTPSNARTGALGTYPIVVEATRRATTQINEKHGTNYTPNQIQSIVWEHHKNYYPPKLRTMTLQKSIEAARSAWAASNKTLSDTVELKARIEAARQGASTKGVKAPTVEQLIEQYRKGVS